MGGTPPCKRIVASFVKLFPTVEMHVFDNVATEAVDTELLDPR